MIVLSAVLFVVGLNPLGGLRLAGTARRILVAANDTEAGRQQNRRVEVVVLREGELASR